jgi:GNAT superfamily N-acetyltransferase
MLDERAGQAARSMRPLADIHELRPETIGDLSDFFNPFLVPLVDEALRCGGVAAVSEAGGRIDGLFVGHETEKVGSVFSRSRAIAEACFREREPLAIFSDFPMGPRPELYHIYAIDLDGWSEPWPFSHPVRAARPEDVGGLTRLLHELQGEVNDRWLAGAALSGLRCFVSEVDGRIAGAAWVVVAGRHARLHSLGVSPRFRGTGLGRDLWLARVLWAREAGARWAISEIAEGNVVSRAISERGGMRPAGRLYLAHRR